MRSPKARGGGGLDSRLVILEGIMGTGKSTTSRWLAGQLRANDIPVTVYGNRKVWGRTPPDALRTALGELTDPREIWSRLSPEDLIVRSRAMWDAFVADALGRSDLSLFDSRFFHADLAGLMMMEASGELIHEHSAWIARVIRPLRPHLVYLHPGDVGEGLRRTGRLRGSAWTRHVSSRAASTAPWSLARLASPYHQRRQLGGVEGSVMFYRDFVQLCDRLLPRLGFPVLRLQTGGGDWTAYRAAILDFLGVPPARDLGFAAWWLVKRPRLWLSRTLGNLLADDPPRV